MKANGVESRMLHSNKQKRQRKKMANMLLYFVGYTFECLLSPIQ